MLSTVETCCDNCQSDIAFALEFDMPELGANLHQSCFEAVVEFVTKGLTDV